MTRSKLCYQKGSVQLHNGQWTVRYRELDHATGKWKWPREVLGQFKSKKAARQAAEPVMQAVNERNNNPAAPPKSKGSLTFKEFVETHWKAYTAKHKPSSLDSWGSLLKTHLLPAFGDKLLCQITPTDITAFLDRLRATMKPNTLQSFYNLLRVMMDVAEQYDMITKSPVRSKLHRPIVPKVDKPTLTAEQINRIIEALPESERLLSWLIAVTTMRINEAQALRWIDFNRTAATIRVEHGSYCGKLQEPKTRASKRTIHLEPVMVDWLTDHKRQSNFQALDDFIFCRPDGSPHNVTTLRAHLREAVTAAGIDWKPGKYGFHAFRHSGATLIYDDSRDLKLVQGTLGHSNIQTTANIYIHQSDSVRAEAGRFLTRAILALSVPEEEKRAG